MTFAPITQEADDGPVQLRAMSAADLPAVLSLLEPLGWSWRESDYETLFALGEGRVAMLGDTVAGAGLRWLWEPRAASVGLVFVAPAYRHRGIGRRLVQALMAGLDDRASLLHAPADVVSFCERVGFEPVDTVRQHEGKAIQAPLMALPPGCRLRPAGRNDLPRLVAMDHAATGSDRRPLLEAWLSHALGAVVLDHADGPRGFAILRRFGRGARIGPVVAPCAASAQAMVAHLMGLAGGRFLHIDTTGDTQVDAWLRELGLACTGSLRTLARGPAAPASREFHTFALADLATG